MLTAAIHRESTKRWEHPDARGRRTPGQRARSLEQSEGRDAHARLHGAQVTKWRKNKAGDGQFTVPRLNENDTC